MDHSDNQPLRHARDLSTGVTGSLIGWILPFMAEAMVGKGPSLLFRVVALTMVAVSVVVTIRLQRSVGPSRGSLLAGLVLALGCATLFIVRADWSPASPPPEPMVSTSLPMAAVSLDAAIALGREGRVSEAIDILDRLVVLESSNASVWANRCGFQLAAGRVPDAEASCRRALSLEPRNWLAQYNAACAWALAAKRDEAIAALRAALDSVEADAGAGLSRGQLAARARDDAMLRSLQGLPLFDSLVRSR